MLRKNGLLVRGVLALLWADILFKFLFYGIWLPLHSPDCDYWKHWHAAIALLEGRTPYYAGPDLYLGFNYPIFTGYIFIFLGFFKMATAEVIWEVLNLLFSVGGAVLAWRYMRPDRPVPLPNEPRLSIGLRTAVYEHWATAAFVLVANFHPLLLNFLPGNIDPLNFLLFMALGAALVQKRDALAGLSIAVLCLIKVAPVLLVVPILFARRWRIFWAMSGLLAAYLFVLLATGLWRWELFLYTEVLPRIGFQYLGISASIHHVLGMVAFPEAISSAKAYARWTIQINLVLVAIYVAVCAAWSARRSSRSFQHLISFSMFMALLMSPLLEYHHYVWVAPAMFIQIREWMSGRISMGFGLLLLFGWIALSSTRIINDFVALLPISPLYFGSSIAIYLAALTAVLAFRTIQPPASTVSPE